MRIEYDREADAAMIYVADDIAPGQSVRQVAIPIQNGEVVLDLADSDVLVGIEVIGASRTLPTTVLEKAQAPGQD